jgi:histidinol dehydrogenase
MLKILTPDQARTTLLRRTPPEDLPVPDALRQRMIELFGQPLTPAQAVERILAEVRREGDAALRRWTERLDGAAPAELRVPAAEIAAALDGLEPELRAALDESIRRVRGFHQKQPAASWITQEAGGTLGQLLRPLRRVGLYVPAGTAPLPSTVIMSAVPAQVAGVGEIAITAPPERATGRVSPLILATAALLGIAEVYPVGGAQAIAALAYGTESIRPVDKICGPGNLFVTLAKRAVYGVTGIDSLAGPTETVVIADESANPAWVAADLLAQAEHDWQASAILLTPSRALAEAVCVEVERQAAELSRREIIAVSLANRGGAVVTRDLAEAVALSNAYGPEHLCLAVADPWRWAEQVTSAGGIFLGEHSFEVLGDYIAGPSHVMPTGGSARFGSPLNVWDFVRVISLIGLNPETVAQIAPLAARIARAEGLTAHAAAAEMRTRD